MSFWIENITAGLVSALIYGMVFSIFCSVCKTVAESFRLLFSAFGLVIKYDRKLFEVAELKRCEPVLICGCFGELIYGFFVIIYMLGFTVLSYFVFDGEIRAFTFLASLLSFFIFEKALAPFLEDVVLKIYICFIKFAVIILRVITYPIRQILLRIAAEFVKKNCKFNFFRAFCHNLFLDKHAKK